MQLPSHLCHQAQVFGISAGAGALPLRWHPMIMFFCITWDDCPTFHHFSLKYLLQMLAEAPVLFKRCQGSQKPSLFCLDDFCQLSQCLFNQNSKKQRNSAADHWTWPLDRKTLQRRRKRLRHRNSFHPDTKMGASCCAVKGCPLPCPFDGGNDKR